MRSFWRTGSLTETESGRSWTAQDIRQQVEQRISTNLAQGYEPGDRVLLHFGNSAEFFVELLAAWQVGACVIPVDHRLTAFELEKLASAARARFHIVDDHTPDSTLSLLQGAELRHTRELSGRRSSDLGSRGTVFPRLDDDALILFTSGSTGAPKGVVHTHRSLLARWSSLRNALGTRRYRRSLCVLPTHFGHGLICNCLFPWLARCDLFIAPPFQTDLVMRLGELINEYRITFLSSVPTVWNLALRTAAAPQSGSLERVHIGSAPLSEGTWRQVQDWCGTREVFNAYGITETGSWVAGTSFGEFEPESGLIGEPWGAQIRIENDGAECRPGETGMIWLHTPALMRGYFHRSDLTDAVIRGGWFMTGDIGLLDDRGLLYLRGRERDEINKGGLKVFPADIDEVVEQFAQTRDVCSFGFEDGFYGENVGLAVVLGDRTEATLLALHDWICAHLAEHKQPVRWHLLEEIPRTSRGKVNRAQVSEACPAESAYDLRDLLARRPARP